MNKVAKAMEKTAISEIPKAKSKNLNVIAEFERRKIKPAANLVVIGKRSSCIPVDLLFIDCESCLPNFS